MPADGGLSGAAQPTQARLGRRVLHAPRRRPVRRAASGNIDAGPAAIENQLYDATWTERQSKRRAGTELPAQCATLTKRDQPGNAKARTSPPICAAFELNIRQVVTMHNGHSVGADEVSVPGAVAEFRVRQIGALSSP